MNVKDLIMCQMCAEGNNIICQMKGNSATVEVNMLLNSWSALVKENDVARVRSVLSGGGENIWKERVAGKKQQ